MPQYSVIIACLNEEKTLLETLESLAAQDADVDWEILFVDNGSTDASRAIFDAFADRHPCIPTRAIDVARRSKAHALNVAIPQAGERVLFLDADDTVAPGWLAAMAAALDRHPLVAARMDYAHLNPPEVRRISGRKGHQKALRRLPHAPWCAYNGGATLGFHRRVFDEVGPFDPRFAALEDVDWCVRAHLKGFRIAFTPGAVYHWRFRGDPQAIFRQYHAYAKHRMLLRKRYAEERAGAWGAARSLASWLVHAAGALAEDRIARLRGDVGLVAAGRRAARLGTALGTLAGAREFRVVPAPRNVSRLLARVRKRVTARAIAAAGRFRPTTVAVRTRAKAMALTFDDGPDPVSTPLLLDRLRALGVKATFFMVGSRALRHPELVARIRAEGHEIGNHSWNHPSFPTLSEADIAEQLRRTREAIGQDDGSGSGMLMRPPYGDMSFGTNRIVRALGYRPVVWTLNGMDWFDDDAETLSARILEKARPGAIVLLHDSLLTFEAEAYRDRTSTLDAVEKVVRALPDWRFVTVSELIALGRPEERGWLKRSSPADLAALGWAEDAHGALVPLTGAKVAEDAQEERQAGTAAAGGRFFRRWQRRRGHLEAPPEAPARSRTGS